MYTSLFCKLFIWFWGKLDKTMLALVAFVVVEALSSTLLAITVKTARKNCKQWISRHITLFLIVGIGNITDCCLANGGNAFRTIIILFYIGYEGSTILENAKKLDLPTPQILFKYLMELCHNKDNDI